MKDFEISTRIPAARIRLALPPMAMSACLVRIAWWRSEEHTSELQSQSNLVCRLLLEKKNKEQTSGPLITKSTMDRDIRSCSSLSIYTTLSRTEGQCPHEAGPFTAIVTSSSHARWCC